MSSKTHQNPINVSSAKFLKTLAFRHIEARFIFTSVAMTDPRDSTKGRLARHFSSCRFRSSGATCFLMSFASVTKMPWSKVFSFDCNCSCAACKRPRFWEVVRDSPASNALDLSNECHRLARLAVMRADPLLSPCFAGDCAVFASASDQPRNGTNKNADHAQPQHACGAHACVEEDTVCTWPWLCFIPLGGTALSSGC